MNYWWWVYKVIHFAFSWWTSIAENSEDATNWFWIKASPLNLYKERLLEISFIFKKSSFPGVTGLRNLAFSIPVKKTKLLILDVDGVLTGGELFIGSDGEILKKFNVKDGLGIKLLQGVGIEIVFMSGGSGGATEERAKQLGIKSCLVGVKDKYIELRTLQQEMKVTKSDTPEDVIQKILKHIN